MSKKSLVSPRYDSNYYNSNNNGPNISRHNRNDENSNNNYPISAQVHKYNVESPFFTKLTETDFEKKIIYYYPPLYFLNKSHNGIETPELFYRKHDNHTIHTYRSHKTVILMNPLLYLFLRKVLYYRLENITRVINRKLNKPNLNNNQNSISLFDFKNYPHFWEQLLLFLKRQFNKYIEKKAKHGEKIEDEYIEFSFWKRSVGLTNNLSLDSLRNIPSNNNEAMNEAPKKPNHYFHRRNSLSLEDILRFKKYQDNQDSQPLANQQPANQPANQQSAATTRKRKRNRNFFSSSNPTGKRKTKKKSRFGESQAGGKNSR